MYYCQDGQKWSNILEGLSGQVYQRPIYLVGQFIKGQPIIEFVYQLLSAS